MANSQPIMIKKYDGIGSCLMIDDAYVHFKDKSTLIRVSVYKDYSAMRRGDNKRQVLDYVAPKVITNIDSMISYLINDVEFFNSVSLTSVTKLPPAPDTTWVNVSSCIFDTTIHRIIGIYAIPDDPKSKQCEVNGIVKHYRNEILLPQYTQEISWMVDNTDSINDPGLGWVHTYDYFKGAKALHNWTDDQVIQFGVSWFDPTKINDRLKY